MTGKTARTKGHNYERKIRREFIEIGFSDCNTSRYESIKRDQAKVDLCNTGVFNIQCKAVEKGINYQKLLSEMPQETNYNIILHKKNRKEIAVLSKADFYELLNMLIKNKIINNE
ncbi:MAG: hypothetical protein K8S16_16680 [Bacteroidales bacterium]|nr:hypothetical protein [Bacteroidales bacterium]